MRSNGRQNERQRMAHIVALLFSFGDIAEGTARRNLVTRCILLTILRVAEVLARSYVQQRDARAFYLPEPIRPDDTFCPAEALHLAWLFRLLGTILATFLAWLDHARIQKILTAGTHDNGPRNASNIQNPKILRMPARSSPARPLRMARLCPVVGMSRQDGGGAVKLFSQHDAHHLVRPCGCAKRQGQFCSGSDVRIVAVRATDRKHCRALPAIAQRAQPVCELFGRKVLAGFVQQDQCCAVGDCQQRPAFFGLALAGRLRTAFGNLGQPGPIKADGRSGFGEAVQISGGKVPFRTRFHAADSMDRYAHRLKPHSSQEADEADSKC